MMKQGWSRILFWAAIVCVQTAWAHAADLIFSEDFDRPETVSGQSILDPAIGWILVGPDGSGANSTGNVLIGSGDERFAGNFLDGSAATVVGSENSFRKPFPTVVSGRVTLSFSACASGETSATSSVGLCPSQPRFYARGGGWISTPDGWEFWVGHVHSNEYPILDGRELGSYRLLKEPLPGAHDTVVQFSMTVDLNRNKAWGEAHWTDLHGEKHDFKTPELDWDSAAGNVSNVLVTFDRRNGRTGIAVDDLRVEGTLPTVKPYPFDARKHIVEKMQGESSTVTTLPAEIQWISQPWDGENAQMPYMVYMPEKNRVLMLASCRKPTRAALIESDDLGKTWSPRRWMHVDSAGNPDADALGLTNLGNGRLVAYPEDLRVLWTSSDEGRTWEMVPCDVPGGELYTWDPLLVLQEDDDSAARLVEGCWRPTGVPRESPVGKYSQAYLQSSVDAGRTWSEPVKVPQWLGTNEVSMIVAANGDWVAACRLDNPAWSTRRDIPDLYSGLGVSVSRDQGRTWSDVNVLHEFGRHHPSMVVLPDGRILMTYAVRLGYPNNAEGFPVVGVEAVVSDDNGQTWDMEHRYVLAKWESNLRGEDSWYCSVQSSSTVLLPDGTILTAFGAGFANQPGTDWCKMDVLLVRWRLQE